MKRDSERLRQAKKDLRNAQKRARTRLRVGKSAYRNPGRQSVSLRNFTGKVKKNPDGTVSILGTGRKANPSKRSTRKRVGAALKKYVRSQNNVAAAKAKRRKK